MGLCPLTFCVGVLVVGRNMAELGNDALRTLAFITVAFGNQATLCAVRERARLWGSRPGLWVIVSSLADIAIAATLASRGVLMTLLGLPVVAGTLAAAIAFAFVLALVKVPVLARLGITQLG